jgi:hypothetical protein
MLSSKKLALPALLAALTSAPSTVWANGAFPDEFTLYCPEDKPHRIVVSTNFGLILTDDDGAHWSWICESAIAVLPYLYRIGAPPDDIMYAVNSEGIYVSKDLCVWTMSTLPDMANQVSDVFTDPSDPNVALAIARPTRTSSPTDFLFETTNGGTSFDKTLYQSAPAERLESVESAKSDPQRIYMMLTRGRPQRRILLRTTDRGGHWGEVDHTADLRPAGSSSTASPRLALIAQVDPKDPMTAYFRVLHIGNSADALAVTHDGGDTLKIIYTLPGVALMTSFLILADGSLAIGTRGGGFISTDSGMSFNMWVNSPELRGLCERDGTVYGAADNFADSFAVGYTKDKSATPWHPLLSFDGIGPPSVCPQVQNACASAYLTLEMMFGIDAGVVPTADGGLITTPPKTGCHCDSTSTGAAGISLAIVALMTAALRIARRKGRGDGP